MAIRRPKSNKNPPIFSHEFVIQNHADIVSCIAMVFVLGLMFQATSPVASLFVTLQHNVTINETELAEDDEEFYYTYGLKDFFTTIFYVLISIVVHAVIQEYILDKLNRKMHLSKVKHSKFNESGQLAFFYAVSAFWGIDLIVRENYVSVISSLWEGYPHATMPFMIKFYYLIQIGYWIHCLPELYFQKVKKEEMAARIHYIILYIIFIGFAYLLNFTRVALCILVLHYTVELVFHLSRLLYFADKQDLANTGFVVWDVLFVLVRLGIITLAVLTFWYGLAKSSQTVIDVKSGNFNIQLVRISCLTGVCLLQAWMMWNFITFHLRRLREANQMQASTRKTPIQSPSKDKKRKSKAKQEDDGVISSGTGDEPPATENGTLRPRSARVKQRL